MNTLCCFKSLIEEFPLTGHLNLTVKETLLFYDINLLNVFAFASDHFTSLGSLYYSYFLDFYFGNSSMETLQIFSGFLLSFQVVTNTTYATVFLFEFKM